MWDMNNRTVRLALKELVLTRKQVAIPMSNVARTFLDYFLSKDLLNRTQLSVVVAC